MNVYRKYAVLLSILGSVCLLVGLAVEDVVLFSPIISWCSSFVLFVVASYFAVKAAVDHK